MSLKFTAKVGKKLQVNPVTYLVEFVLPADQECDFLPGQFMSIAVQGFVRRSYSIVNPPHESGKLVTYVDVTPGGPGSKFFEELAEVEEVDMFAPLGHFMYIPDTLPVHFFATGVGIAPFISMIRHELEEVKSGREVYLYYGARHEDGLLEDEMWRRLAGEFAQFQYRPFVSQPQHNPDPDKLFETGRITQVIEQLPALKADAYICGGGEMILDVEMRLLEQGFADERIYYERFY